MNSTQILGMWCCALLSPYASAQVASFSDDFESSTLNSFWTPRVRSGSITFPATAQVHGGRQSVQFNSVVQQGTDKFISLIHVFAQPTYGSFSVWMYDGGAGVLSLNYVILNVDGTSVFVTDYDLGVSNGGTYVYNPQQGGPTQSSTIRRTQGWHLLSVTATPAALVLSVDGSTIHSGAGRAPVGFVELIMQTADWRPAWTSYFDDFAFKILTAGAYTTFGAGCVGTYGVPTIHIPVIGPVIGTPFAVLASSLPPFAPTAFGIIGTSNARLSNGTPLPLALGIIGMPGCQLLVSPDLIQVIGDRPTYGLVRWTLPIPNSAQLIGTSFFQQVAATDSLANPLGIVVSNAGQATIGGFR